MEYEQLKQIQAKQATIMDDIHRVCVENGLRYYLIGGSAIGAARHKGFIPWDVDIDIAMPRVDYERFIKIAANELAQMHKLYYHGNQRHYRSGHAIVALQDSKIVFANDNLNPQIKRYGLYVDVLPLDYVPTSSTIRCLQKRTIKTLKSIKGIFLIKYKSTDRQIIRGLKKLLIPLFQIAPTSTICAITHWVTKWGNYNQQSKEICSMHSHYTYDRLCMPVQWFDNPVLAEFSARKYYVATENELYLTKLFGNYNKLPSKEEQEHFKNLIIDAQWKE